MAQFKFCAQPVRTATVFHSACWNNAANKVAEPFCDNYCRFPRECTDQDSLEQHCDTCDLVRLLNLGL